MNDQQGRSDRGRWVRMRMGVLCGLLALGLGLLVSSAWRLMIADGTAWRELAEKQRQRRLHVVPKRGTIYDRNGSALAVSVEVPSVSMDAVELLRGVPGQRQSVVARDAANAVAKALALDPAVVEKKILRKRRFSWLKRRITAQEAERIGRLGSSSVMGRKRIRGLLVEGEGRRYCPRRELLGPLLGLLPFEPFLPPLPSPASEPPSNSSGLLSPLQAARSEPAARPPRTPSKAASGQTRAAGERLDIFGPPPTLDSTGRCGEGRLHQLARVGLGPGSLSGAETAAAQPCLVRD